MELQASIVLLLSHSLLKAKILLLKLLKLPYKDSIESFSVCFQFRKLFITLLTYVSGEFAGFFCTCPKFVLCIYMSLLEIA